jgi:ABC-type antimicrobial peptide transport system permease subunit
VLWEDWALPGTVLGAVAGAVMVSRVGGLLPGVPPATAAVTPRTLLVSVAVGIFVAVLAGGGAVRRALRIPPVAALRSRARLQPSPQPVARRDRVQR